MLLRFKKNSHYKSLQVPFIKGCLALFLLVIAAILSGCGGLIKTKIQPEYKPQYNPLDCRIIPDNGGNERLCVLLAKNRGDLWFVVGDSEYSDHRLVEGFSVLGGSTDGPTSFGGFTISPGGSYLSVLTAEEGHPLLRFEHMKSILTGEPVAGDLPSFAPYPGGVHVERWLLDDQAVIGSTQDLVNYRHGDDNEGEYREYILSLPGGKLQKYNPVKSP